MKRLFLVLFSFASVSLYAQTGLYDPTYLADIKIYFGFSNWDTRMDTAIAGYETYTPCDSVVVNGKTFLGCGVKYKGNSSYSANRAKNPLHIKLDYTFNGDYEGYTDLKLANGFSDPSMVREVSSYAIARQYMDAPLSNLAKVYINGTYYGIMTNDQSIDDKFNLEHFCTSYSEAIKCNPQNAGPGSGNGSSLAYLGTTQSSYYNLYELNSDTGWDELIGLTDTLNNYFSAFPEIADVDRFLWMLAFNNVLVNLDSYSGSFRQNYYLYHDHNNRWIPTPWDLNMSYGSFTMSGTGAPLSLANMQNLSILLHQNDTAWPLINKLLNNPMYLRMYLAHCRTILNENFTNANYKTFIEDTRTLASSSVSSDPNYLYTFTQFQNALTTTTSGGGPMGGTVGIYQLMDTRASYLAGISQMTAATPVISNIVISPTTPAFGSTVNITATVTNTNTSAVYLGYRYSKCDGFVRVLMYDDGAHNDGAAGDNVYGASFVASSLDIQYYFYAENNNAGIFSPVRAEHEFYSLTPTITMATGADIALNEVMANNATGITNENGDDKDWIEIVNKTSAPLGLGNLFVSDDQPDLQKWQFPADAWIPANGYQILWADDLDETYIEYHVNFNLSSSVDTVIISDMNGTITDNLTYTNQVADNSLARCPDATGVFTLTTTPTPRAANSCPNGIETIDNQDTYTVYPNPSSDQIRILSDYRFERADILDLAGQVVLQDVNPAYDINVSGLSPGVYIIRLDGQHIQRFVIARP